jgi:hypothetical protein
VRGTRNGHTTALFADECQSFLDNVIAGLGQIGSWKDPRIGSQGRPGRSATARIYEFAMDSWRDDIASIVAMPDVKQRLETLGSAPVANTPGGIRRSSQDRDGSMEQGRPRREHQCGLSNLGPPPNSSRTSVRLSLPKTQ